MNIHAALVLLVAAPGWRRLDEITQGSLVLAWPVISEGLQGLVLAWLDAEAVGTVKRSDATQVRFRISLAVLLRGTLAGRGVLDDAYPDKTRIVVKVALADRKNPDHRLVIRDRIRFLVREGTFGDLEVELEWIDLVEPSHKIA